MTGYHTTLKADKINYKVLKKINSEAARVFEIQRNVVYDILKKNKEEDLKDRSYAPLHSPHKTPIEIEDKGVKAKNQIRLWAKR